MKRYKRLALHLIVNKVDPLQLDELKYTFLQQSPGNESVSVTVEKFRGIVRHVLNTEKRCYEERFLQALVPDYQKGSRESEQVLVGFDSLQKLVDIFEASCAMLNESLANPNTYYNDPISGH